MNSIAEPFEGEGGRFVLFFFFPQKEREKKREGFWLTGFIRFAANQS